MKIHYANQAWIIRIAIVAAGLGFVSRSPCQPGSVDLTFDPGSGVNGIVWSLAAQSNGKIIIAGDFTSVGGAARNQVARLNPDGSLDTTFSPGTWANINPVYAVAVQTDDKVLVGGLVGGVSGTVARFNPDGSLDNTFNLGTGVNNAVYAVAVQTDGKVLVGGYFTLINGTTRNGIARLNADGSLDSTFDPGTGANDGVLSIAVQTDGKVLVGGNFTTINTTNRNRIARLNADGSLDSTFDPGTGANNPAYSIIAQTDGKVLVGGSFTLINGTTRNGIARLNANGSLDGTFDPGTVLNSYVYSLALQTDSKVLVGGGFNYINNTARNGIARLNADGSLDSTFDPGTGLITDIRCVVLQADGKVLLGGDFTGRLNADGSLDSAFNPGTGANNFVQCFALQTDGKVLVGGYFTSITSTMRNRIARLNAGGSLDGTFDPGTGANNFVQSITLQADGKVLVGGAFTIINGTNRNRIARVNADGSLDNTFDPGTGANNLVRSVALQSDGKVLLGGDFTTINGTNRNRIARLNADGSLDSTLNPGAGTGGGLLYVSSVAVQMDGKIVVGGAFTSINGASRNRIARLNADGSLDSTFNPGTGANNSIRSVVVQPDGKLLVGGFFTAINGTSRRQIARLNADGSLDSSFNPGTWANGNPVFSVAVQKDGKVVAVGAFALFINGKFQRGIARLNADGSVDSSFNPGTGAYNDVYSVALQTDGKVLVGGDFSAVNGVARAYVARLLGDPTISIQKAGNQVVLTWMDSAFSLQSAPFVTGTYTNVSGATSPYTNSISGGQRYFRLKAN